MIRTSWIPAIDGLRALAAAAVGGMVVISALGKGTAARFLSAGPLRAVGTLSYSIYLVHVIGLTLAMKLAGQNVVTLNGLAIMLVLLIAIILYLLMKGPFVN
jgi:peptidoglycan/LPS O-acetylase OafA/YrhL